MAGKTQVTQNEKKARIESALHKVFGNYRAEWLSKQVFELYQPPHFMLELAQEKPVILQGGRGTGKTTALLAMSYEGRFAIEQKNVENANNWEYFACYLRMNSSRIGNFRGGSKDDDFWRPIFAHYLNLLMVSALLDMASWAKEVLGVSLVLPKQALHVVSTSLGVEHADDLESLRVNVLDRMIDFEKSLQRHLRGEVTELSLQGAPVEYLCDILRQSDFFENKMFFFLIDEFENLQPYQQKVVNTLIKHSGGRYSVKVGMRPYGWSTRLTITGETLMEPMDYSVVPIGKRSDANDDLAERICNERLSALNQILSDQDVGQELPIEVKKVFPGLSIDAEFELLGGSREAELIRQQLTEVGIEHLSFDDRQLFTIATFADQGIDGLSRAVQSFLDDPAALDDKMNNYGYAALFTIRRGKSGIRKYYCGWKVLLDLSDGNIRFLLWLVHRCLVSSIEKGYTFGEPIDAEVQTQAAIDVGEKVLRELPDESQSANMLIRLVLGVGRIFQVLAANPRGHLPEATQFHRGLAHEPRAEVGGMLQEGVRHLALVEYTATKMQRGSVKDIDFTLHPIFCPFFSYSHRRKRKLKLSDEDLLSLSLNPGHAHAVLKRLKAGDSQELPEQMSLYEELFN